MSWKERWLRVRSALFVVVFSFAGCGAFFIGLELAGSDDCLAFSRFLPGHLGVGLCERYGSIAAAAPLILIGAALIVFLFVGARWIKEPPTPAPPMTPRSRRFAKVAFALIGLYMIGDGFLLLTGVEPCSDLKVGSFQYRAVGDGLAKLCEVFGPAIPAAFFIFFGALILLGIYKGMFDGE